MTRKHEILFIDPVGRGGKPYALVHDVGCPILLLYVESDPTDLRLGLGFGDDMVMHGPIDTLAAPGWSYVDTLHPPEDSVTPITPFKRDHQLADEPMAARFKEFGNHKKSELRSRE
jgi:hypothetical protein